MLTEGIYDGLESVACNFNVGWRCLVYKLNQVYHYQRRVETAEFRLIGVLDIFMSRDDAADFKAEGVGLISQYTGCSGGDAVFVTPVTDDSEVVGPECFCDVWVVWFATGFV
jgi:hypothetical protein